MENNSNDRNNENDVAIVGIGFRLPGCETFTPNELWNNLKNGFNGVVELNKRWSDSFYTMGKVSSAYAGLLPFDELKSFDPLFFGINPSEVPTIDPQQRLLLKCTWEAFEDAGIDPMKFRASSTSVFIGTSTNDYQRIIREKDQTITNAFGTSLHATSNRISYCFDFRGPSMTLDTACSSSLNCVKLGYQSIKDGTSNLAIAGGVNLIIDPYFTASISDLNILSKTGSCKTFDANADGFARAEGAGIIIMKNLKQAIIDGDKIYCVIKGASSNVDGGGLQDKSNFYAPSSISQSNNIKMALKSTNGSIEPKDISYFECHGTGTPTGDPIETRGISIVFNDETRSKENPLLIGSIKSNIGHLEAGSGIASLMKCCLMFKNKCFAPNINFKVPNPKIKFDEWNLKVVTEPIPFSKPNTCIGLSNFGVTGSNCCLILSQFNDNNNSNNNNNNNNNQKIITIHPSPKREFLIPLSSNSVKSLEKYQKLLIDDGNNSFEFSEFIKHQIFSKPTSFYQRSVVIASDWDGFKNANQTSKRIQTSNSKSSNISIKRNNPTTVFVFCGQGSQYNTMGLDLYNNEPVFKRSMDLLDSKLSKYYGHSVLEKFRNADSKLIHHPTLAQPVMSMFNISLFELYKHWGIKPSFIVGHSLGEIPASYCSGMITLDTLCFLIYHRSIAQSKTHGNGRMLSINISADEYIFQYSYQYPDIEIACYNSPSSIVIGGNEQTLNEISEILKEKGIFSVMLGSLSSFHTSSQNKVKDDILNRNFDSKAAEIPTFSTVTTNLFDPITCPFNSSYVFNNIVNPVKFSQTISNIYKHIESNQLGTDIVFIELAPHPTLSFYLKQMIPKPNDSIEFKVSIYSALNKKKNDIEEIQKTISQLYCDNGYSIDFKSQFDRSSISNINQFANISLPHYQWDDEKYWKEDPSITKLIVNGPATDNLGYSNENSPNVKSYETFIDIKKLPFQYLKSHMVKGKYYFPGCGYIDNLLKMYPSQDLTINHMGFKSPLIFIEGASQCLQTNVFLKSNLRSNNISNNNNNEFRVEYHFNDQKTNQWTLSSYGDFQLSNHQLISSKYIEKINIKQLIQTKCNLTKLSKDELYTHLKAKTGLSYTGVFQGVNTCYMGENCSLSEVSLDLKRDLPSPYSFFNTSVLDTCLHGMLCLLEEQCQLVFDRIEGFKYHSLNVPKSEEEMKNHSNIYVYSIINPRVGDSYSASIVIMLTDGTVLIEIENAVCTSLTPIKNPLSIKYPTNELFSIYLQPKDSPIPSPSSFKSLYSQEKPKISSEFTEWMPKCKNFVSNQFFSNIIKRIPEINLEIINSMNMEELKLKYCQNLKNERLFQFVFETIKQFGLSSNDLSIMNINSSQYQDNGRSTIYEILSKSTKVIPKLLFPLKDEDPSIDSPQSLFENGLLDRFYNNPNLMTNQCQIIGQVIKESIKPLLNEKMVFRILEFGGGICSLSVVVLNLISQLLQEYPSFEIDIEYTWSDVSTSFIAAAKEKLSHIDKRINILYRAIDIEQPFIEKQGLKPSYYDFVIMSNVLHVVKRISPTLEQIHKILTPNGQLLFVEIPYKELISDSIFGAFSQWWAFEDTDIRNDRCSIPQQTWQEVLSNHNYKDILVSDDSKNIWSCFVIHAQKPTLLELSNFSNTEYDNIIVFGNENNQNYFTKSIKSSFNKINWVSSFEEIKKLIKLSSSSTSTSTITDNSIVYFTKGIEELTLNNFKSINFEYIEINKLLLKYGLKCKHVLVTRDCEGSNYLASSLIGAARYFDEYRQLQLFTLDFDNYSIQWCDECSNNIVNLMKVIEPLIDPKANIQREFLIRNNQVYFERAKLELNLKKSFKSESFENNNNLISTLTSNLEYQLLSKSCRNLRQNEIEVEIKATGINYKDYLKFSGSIEKSNQSGVSNQPEFGIDFSGIVTKVGNNDHSGEFKIGDKVYGIGYNTTSSHIIIDSRYACHIPNGLDHIKAASIASSYIMSLYGIFDIGNLDIDDNESILIHSGTGGIGLSALNTLKWKGHKSHVFVTVGSKEKEQYLRENYGDFITEIYSNKDRYYPQQIKSKLKQLFGSNKQGVDLILNTLPNDDFNSLNTKCLAKNGRIVNLSIDSSQINTNNNIDLFHISKTKIKRLLNTISKGFDRGELVLMPITEFSNLNIRDAIEYINERQHIGKIVVSHDSNILGNLISEHSKQSNYQILKSDYQIPNSSLGKNILITGQSGIVLEMLKWMVKYSNTVENVIILSKSSIKWELELLIGKTIKKSNNQIKFHFKSVDVSDSKLVEKSIDKILNDNPRVLNIDSIFHFAFIQISKKVDDIDMESLNVSHNAKTIGAINLHNESIRRNWKLKQFVMASSATSIVGSTDQCSYVCANSVLDSLSKYRNSIGLPSICTNYGAIESAGFVSKNESVAAMFNGIGINSISTNLILGTLDLQIQNQQISSNLILSDFNFLNFANNNLQESLITKFDFQTNLVKNQNTEKSIQHQQHQHQNSTSTDSQTIIKDSFLHKISEVLSIETSKLNLDLKLLDYGADSLAIVQIKNWIDQEVSPNLIVIQQLQSFTIGASIQYTINSLLKKKVQRQE
ncbi:hypothetical protein RB653_010300 [Dictyostelium firmibasis]|uniref:Carrier domain-containing protein n=1 Tax=Dictyostelium firmibasis TaxID=79012 RepID=A0AAN7YVI1_9MYCE